MQNLQCIIPFLLSATVLSTRYPGQIIAMVDSDQSTVAGTKYLLERNPEVSQVVRWLPTDENDPSRGGRFIRVEWIISADGEYGAFAGISRGMPRRPTPIDSLPHGGRIQVLGHGELNEQTNTVELGRMNAFQLSEALKTLPLANEDTAGAIKRVSLIGCHVGNLNADGTDFVGDRFPETLLLQMRNTVDEVSSRNGLVAVDSSGRKLHTEPQGEGINWSIKPGTITKTVISLDDTGRVYRSQEKISQYGGSYYRSPRASSQTVRTNGGSIELEETGAAVNPEHVKLNSDDLFHVISTVAKEHFQAAPEDSNWNTRVENERLVRVIHQGVPRDMSIKIREFSNYAELTQEIKQWGEKGFEFPSYDKNANTWTTTDSNGEPFADKYIFYRYGDFVYRVKVQSGLQVKGSPKALKPFHTTLEGVIVNENPNGGATKNTELDLSQYRLSHSYAQLQPQTDNNFFSDVRKWISGEHSQIGRTRTNAINGEATIAMFTCEAARDYRVHVTNKLSLDLNAHVQTFDRNVFFDGLPIGRGHAGSAREHGIRKDFYETKLGKPRTNYKVRAIREQVGSLLQQWADAGYKDSVRRVQKRPAGSTSTEATDRAKRIRLISGLKDSLKDVMTSDHKMSSEFIEDHSVISGPLFAGPFDARKVQEPQIKSVNSEVNEYHETEDRSLPLQMSQAMLRDQLYVSNKISQAVEAREAASRKHFEINEDSIAVRGRKVTYEIYEPSNPSSRQHVETDLDESKMTSKHLMDEMHEQAQILQQQQEEGTSGRINKGLGIYGTVLGIKGTVEAFERGDFSQGSIYLAQSLHGIGELSGLNPKIYGAAGKAVGKIASKAVGRVSETIGQVVGEDAGLLIAGEGTWLLSNIGKVRQVFKDIPIVGTAFGIYYIYEDIQRHTVIGYVDAGLDTLITVLGFLGPEAEPFVIALTIIRLSIDTFYTDIKKELDSLPPDASTGQEVLAVLKGIDEAIFDIGDTITGGIFSASSKIVKLEERYEGNQQFLSQMADYHNYFKVTMCSGDAPAINFAGAADSWNGGNINFKLLEGGRRGLLTMEGTLTTGQERTHSEISILNFKLETSLWELVSPTQSTTKSNLLKCFG